MEDQPQGAILVSPCYIFLGYFFAFILSGQPFLDRVERVYGSFLVHCRTQVGTLKHLNQIL